MINAKKLITLALTATLATACGKHNSPVKEAVKEETPSTHQDLVTTGTMLQTIDELQKSVFAGECDRKLYSLQKEITTALADHQDLISKAGSKNDIPEEMKKTLKTVKFGSSILVENVKAPRVEDSWIAYDRGWEDVKKDFEVVQKTNTADLWFALDQEVKGIMFDDINRLANKVNYQLDKDSAPMLKGLIETIGKCKADTTCTRISWSSDQIKFITGNTIYGYVHAIMEQDKDLKDLRQIIEIFAQRIQDDFTRYGLTPHTDVQYEAGASGAKKTFTLPLDGTRLDDDQRSIFQKEVEKVWNSAASQLLIQWITTVSGDSIFKIFFDLDSNNSRDWTSTKSHKEMHIIPKNDVSALAHETGHVLGFADHYFKRWNTGTCRYTTQLNNGDIMSEHQSEHVTDEEWKELEEAYGNKKTVYLKI